MTPRDKVQRVLSEYIPSMDAPKSPPTIGLQLGFLYPEPRRPEFAELRGKLVSLDGVASSAFPELLGKDISIIVTGCKSATAQYDFMVRRVEFSHLNCSGLSMDGLGQVLFHELTHARQHIIGDIPSGERACDVFSIGRMPDNFIESDSQFCYVSVPESVRKGFPKLVRDLAVEAIEHRAGGLRNYIKWFENEVKAVA